MNPRLCHIVAAAANDVIGANNALPWDIPEDLKFFKDKTKNSIIIMGRKTFDSLGKALPQRLNIVVTRQADFRAENCLVADSLKAALREAYKRAGEWGAELFIIGGGEIYAQSMDIVDRIYLTRIHREFDGPVRYPTVDPQKFRLTQKSSRAEPIPFDFLTYDRVT
jgi:dihydrofolate reductase